MSDYTGVGFKNVEIANGWWWSWHTSRWIICV